MRVMILGGSGMLGHKLWQALRDRFDTLVAVRQGYANLSRFGIFDPQRLLAGVDVNDFDSVLRAFSLVHPDVVVNAIGIIKQLRISKDPIATLTVNSIFPHRLALLTQSSGVRLIHISTDCVFSGLKGMYTEEDGTDAEDLYGRSKALGEVTGPNCLTIRTSIIGRELQTTNGLVEWFLSNRGGRVQGYVNAIYSGFPTLTLSHIIGDIIDEHEKLSGIYHVSSKPINKYDLLCLIRDAYDAQIEIDPYPDVRIDRSLDSARFQNATGFKPRPWKDMVNEMAKDPTKYDDFRKM